MNVAGAKLGAVVMMAISLLLARCTGSVSSSATGTRTSAAVHITARTQVRVTPIVSVASPRAPHPSVSAGVTWSVVPSINPRPASTSNTLSSVSCVSATSCMAVGETDYKSGAVVNLAESWRRSFYLVKVLQPGPSVALGNVSCVSSDSCFVFGLTANAITAFANWRNARVTKWSLLPGGNNIDLRALSCPAATRCVAVGFGGQGTLRKTLVESWSGKRWSVARSPNRRPSHDYDDLNSVSCASPRFCVAVGTYGLQIRTRLSSSKTLVEMWNGTRWSVVPSRNAGLPSDFDFLNSVACYSPTFCIAVGSYANYGGSIERTLVEHWNGRAWSIMRSPNRGGVYGAEDELNGVACSSPHQCVAVGDYQTGPGDQFQETLVESWSGARWTLDTSAVGGSPSDASLVSVSCATGASCVAVGHIRAGLSQPYQTLVEMERAP
jgi:hypothetical protein